MGVLARFQLGGKALAQFGDLGCNDGLAVGLKRMFSEVVLMVGLGGPESRRRCYAGDDRRGPDALCFQVGYQRVRDLLLLRCVGEDRRPILRTDVVALPVRRGRVMDSEKSGQEHSVIDQRWGELHPHDLGMICPAAADLLVARLFNPPAHVAGDDALYPP